jgi:hypothetical protein
LAGNKQGEHKFQWGARFSVNNGKSVRFWEDVWVREVPLKLIFPKLYEYSGVRIAW